MTLGSVGHHFPSFLRTYGDKEIFRRYRVRLLLAPPLFFATTLWFSIKGLHGMLLVSMCWSIWHGMMQHFGFMRIYDHKVGAADERTARLDWWISASWFATFLTFSPHQGGALLDALYDGGVPIVPLTYLESVRTVVIAVTAVVTLFYVDHAVRGDQPRSWLKLLLLGGTFSYLWLVRVVLHDPYLSVALFEVLHDVQYLAIVWAFNRRLTEKGSGSTLARWFYRPGAIRVGGYVLVCLAYGGIALFVSTKLDDGLVKQVMEAALITSGLLHFYYDGFIWKLGQVKTKRGLGIEAIRPARSMSSGLTHALVLSVPIVVLASLELKRLLPDELTKARAIAEAVPGNPTSRNNLGWQLVEHDRFEEAVPELRAALALQPDLEPARDSLSAALMELSQASARSGRREEAIERALEAVEVAPDSPEAHNNFGVQLGEAGRFDQAEREWRRVLELSPGHDMAQGNLEQLERMRRADSP